MPNNNLVTVEVEYVSGDSLTRPDLSGEAIRLGRLLMELLPEPEVVGSGYSQEPARDFARSMPEAISRLRGSDFARDWLGTRFVDGFTATRESQHDEFRRKVPDVELQRFFDLG